MTFDFATAGRILFGRGKSDQVPALARDLGRRALVVLGGSGRGRDALVAALSRAGVSSVVFLVPGEPTTDLVDEAIGLARAEASDVIVAQGGGSVIDAAKAVAVLLTNPGAVRDYLEVVGAGKPLLRPGVPLITVPTTAGTGAEVTRNAVLDVPEHKVKVSLRSPHLLARAAVIDPDLTQSLPRDVTAFTGMDALTQLIEPFVGCTATPITDGVCREGLVRAGRSLRSAYHDGSDPAAREEMALAALCSGIALANAKLGAVHGIASVLGGMTSHPHGALCARLLPFVMEANVRAVGERGSPATLERFREVARILTGNPAADASDGVAWVHDLCTELKIPSLRDAGLSLADCGRIIPPSQRASSTQGNPVKLTDDELGAILAAAL